MPSFLADADNLWSNQKQESAHTHRSSVAYVADDDILCLRKEDNAFTVLSVLSGYSQV